MNLSKNTLFLTLLLLFVAGAVEAQQSENRSTSSVNSAASVEQYIPTEGDHTVGEIILTFDSPQTNKEKQALERKLYKTQGMTIKEWSPSGRYVLVHTNKKDDQCYLDVNGNPDSDAVGGGDGVSLNYTVGTNYWDSQVDCENVTIHGELIISDPDLYTLTGQCGDIKRLEPNFVYPWNTKAKVAIIDSGVKGLESYGRINNVPVYQKVVPALCNTTDCGIREPRVGESAGFNSHGRFITSLITGWFRANHLDDKLQINSYKVLDNELKCRLFQVVKAIEEATADGNHIISLSLGFIPGTCDKPDSGPDRGPLEEDFPIDGGKSDKSEHKSLLYYAIKAAEDAGVIVITSAGNDNNDLAESPQYPAAETGLDNLVTVGALACGEDVKASFSNWSEELVDLFTIGDQVQVVDELCYRKVRGTSFACPVVTAKAAFHVTMQPVNNYDYNDVLCQLRSEAKPFPGKAKYGIVDSQVPPQSCNKSALPNPENPITNRANAIDEPVGLVISPNPFNDQLTINIPEAEAFLTIIDARGARVLQREAHQAKTTLDLSDLKPGVYWVSVRSATGTQTKSIVKQ